MSREEFPSEKDLDKKEKASEPKKAVKKEKAKDEEPKKDKAFKQYIARCTTDELNCRKGPGTKYDIETQLNKGVAITIVAEEKVDDGGTWCKAKSGYWVNKKYLEFVKYV